MKKHYVYLILYESRLFLNPIVKLERSSLAVLDKKTKKSEFFLDIKSKVFYGNTV